MKYFKYVILPFFAAGILLFFIIQLYQPAKEQAAAPGKRYLAIVPTDAVDHNDLLLQGIQDAALERNVYVKFLETASFDEQKYEVDKALYSGYDGIILCPMDNGPEAFRMMQAIRENNLELVTLFNDISRIYPCLASSQHMGEQAASILLSQSRIPKNIYIMTGNSQNIIYRNRAASFASYLQKQGITVVNTLFSNIDIISSADQVKKYISKNNIEYLFCTDAASTAAAAKCLNSSFLKNPPKIYGCDYLHTTEECFDTGILSSLIYTDYYNTGYYSVFLLDDLASGIEDTCEEYQKLCVTLHDASNPFVPPAESDGNTESTYKGAP